MSLLTFEQSLAYESVCKQLQQNEEIQFAGFVNNKGRMFAGQTEGQFAKLGDEEEAVFLMEIALEFSMKNEFNKRFGTIEYVFSKRGTANIICMPVHENILVIISLSHIEPQKIIEKCTPVIQTTLEVRNT